MEEQNLKILHLLKSLVCLFSSILVSCLTLTDFHQTIISGKLALPLDSVVTWDTR